MEIVWDDEPTTAERIASARYLEKCLARVTGQLALALSVLDSLGFDVSDFQL